HISKLGILLRPLYEKTNAHGDKRLKPSDYQLIGKIKRKVQQLPDLSIPPEEAHIILEVDGCMEGWGGIVKWKQKKEDPRSTEKVCAYASGKFTNVQSTIDAEINACINTIEKLKIYYLDKQEITLRTDCQAIISFYKKTSSSKASRVRWMKFADAVEGKHNVLADSLSRLVNSCVIVCTIKEKEPQMKMITRAAAAAVDKVLTKEDALENEDNSHGTSQKKEQEISKQISQISNHCLQSIQELSKPRSQQGSIKESKGKPIHTQSMWTSLVPLKELQEPWKQQQSRMPSQHSQKSMKLYDIKPRYAAELLTNFIRAMQGGIRIEGDEITIYKKVTKFKTTNQAEITQVAIEELEMDELEYQAIMEEVAFHQEVGSEFRRKFEPVLKDLKSQGYIGEEPLKHWRKNGELCKLDII
ncbi:putative polyprotein, partial [Tanacetum coccineum]